MADIHRVDLEQDVVHALGTLQFANLRLAAQNRVLTQRLRELEQESPDRTARRRVKSQATDDAV